MRHPEFQSDLTDLPVQLDPDLWASIKALLRRAAQGTVRSDEWEYPCATSRGLIGELKLVHAHEPDNDGVFVDVWHRVYYHEPQMCPEELWAAASGSKMLDDPDAADDQQHAIDRAKVRIETTDRLGREMIPFPEVLG